MGRGQVAGPVAFFVAIAAGFLTLILTLYVALTITGALNNSNLTTLINLLMQGVLNFAAQLGTVGTIAGVMLIVAIVFGAGYLGYQAVTKRGGGSGM